MKKYRGFRLGRRLAFIWRSLHRPPSKHRGYLRLSSDGPTHRKRDPTKEMEEKNAVAARIAHWGRCLAQRLGHLAVYVGREGVDPLYRVMVPVVFFNHPLFGELLKSAQEEFGFCRSGASSSLVPSPTSRASAGGSPPLPESGVATPAMPSPASGSPKNVDVVSRRFSGGGFLLSADFSVW
ncbi:unnamed protein product [Spirodela intermedia]|uniref:Uncharacterized protein n=1 Tax=Spirodela intermedia TaxID=51605 RepID=A0A7I8IZS7_SPIIN|nr:unnamed protein product [Spirodela intermedia]CAA6663309.1 unnamed protein product [Spirodela intermedia]